MESAKIQTVHQTLKQRSVMPDLTEQYTASLEWMLEIAKADDDQELVEAIEAELRNRQRH
jgi:hypothetical protein